MYIILRYEEYIEFPERYANIANVMTTGAETPVTNPSNPSVRLVPFETAVITNIITRMYITQPAISPALPLNGASHA